MDVLGIALTVLGALLQLTAGRLVFLDMKADRADATNIVGLEAQVPPHDPLLAAQFKEDETGWQTRQNARNLAELQKWHGDRFRSGLPRHRLEAWLILIGTAVQLVGALLLAL
jgi:hypothetical protein